MFYVIFSLWNIYRNLFVNIERKSACSKKILAGSMRLNSWYVNSWSPGGLHVPPGPWSSLFSGNWCHTSYRHRGLVILSHHGKSFLLFTPIPHFNQVLSQYLIGWDHQWQWDGNIHPPLPPEFLLVFMSAAAFFLWGRMRSSRLRYFRCIFICGVL